MTLADLLRETIELPDNDVWENERTPTPVRVFGVRLHSMGPTSQSAVTFLYTSIISSLDLAAS